MVIAYNRVKGPLQKGKKQYSETYCIVDYCAAAVLRENQPFSRKK